MGATINITGESLVEILNKLPSLVEEWQNKEKVLTAGFNTQLDGVTLMFKQEGKWMCVGNNGIESAVTRCYSEEPKENFCLCLHFD